MTKPDRIAVFLGHPAHYHMFKHMVAELERRGVVVDFLVKRKDMLEDLVQASGHKYIVVRNHERSKTNEIGLILALIRMEIKVIAYLLRYRPQLLIGTYAPVLSHLTRIPMIICCEDDTAIIPRFAKTSYPYATAILTPQYCDGGKWDSKMTKYAGFQKLAYLHPNHFTPQYSIVKPHLRNPQKEYVLLRFSRLWAHHDDNIRGMTNVIAIRLVNMLSTKYDIYISSERPLCKELESYRMTINPQDIHHWLAFASIYVGDSQSMAVESAMLGTPSIRFSDFAHRIGVLNTLEERYNLTSGIPTDKPDQLFSTVEHLMNTPNLKEVYQQRREAMLAEQIDVTSFYVEYVSGFLEKHKHNHIKASVPSKKLQIITSLNEINKNQWQDLLNNSNVPSFFQSIDAATFFNNLNNIGIQLFGVTEDNVLVGMAVVTIYREGKGLKKELSKRAIINGGLLLGNNISNDALQYLLKGIIHNLHRTTTYIEIRNFNDYTPWKETIENAGFTYEPHYNYHITTSNFESRINKVRRYEVRRGFKEGATIESNPTLTEIHALYDILHELYRTRVKRPLFSLDFFEQLYKQPFAHFIVVKHNEEVVGGTVCVGLPGQTLYEWYACGKRGEKYRHLFPSTMATYGAIDYAAKNGHPMFDMMGAGTPTDGGYGVRDFKAKFGGELVEHGRFIYICKLLVYFMGKTIIKLKKLGEDNR